MQVLLIRHATAGSRAGWQGDDRDRPLDRRGRRQAEGLPAALAGVPVHRILTSPYARCVATVAPLAAVLGLEIEEAPELAEGTARDEVLRLVTSAGSRAALCTHGDVCHELLGPRRTPKGSAWIIDVGGDSVVRPVRRVAAPG